MEKKQSVLRKIANLLTGKGFYIVLILCIAIIGVSAWALLFADKTGNSKITNAAAGSTKEAMAVVSPGDNKSGDVGAMTKPSGATAPSAAPSQKPSASPSAAPKASPSPSAGKTSGKLTYIWPLSGKTEVGYSMKDLIYDKTLADWRTHDGVDIAAQLGTKVMSIAAGTVKNVYADGLYGTTVVIDHGSGIQSIYSNLQEKPTVEIGDKVAMGAVIGAVGDTAIAEAGEITHLHFGMTKDGKAVDPASYLPEN